MWSRSRLVVDITVVGLLALLPLLFFWRLITPVPTDQMNIAAGDFGEQYFPLRAFTAQEWVAGRLPLWNPYLYGGQPSLADIQSGALYPPHILQALLLGWGTPLFTGADIGFPLKMLEWQVIFHFSIALMGTFLFSRFLLAHHGFNVRPARLGAVVASVIFGFGGYLTGFPVQQLTILEGSTWLPWVLWTLTVALWQMGQTKQTGKFLRMGTLPAWIAGGGVCFGMAILAGHPQTVMYIFYLSLVYVVFLGFYWRPTAQSRTGRLLRVLAVWSGVVGLGTALAAAQLWPTLEFIGRSVRANMSYDAVSAGLPLTELVTVIYPGFFGGSPAYVGIAGLILVFLALVVGLSQQEMKTISSPTALHPHGGVGCPGQSFLLLLFWAVAALISLLLAFGDNLFVFPVAYLALPGFDAVRQQERVFLLYSFSLAMLAGYGAAFLSGPLAPAARQALSRFEHRLRWVGGVAVFATGLFIYGATNATIRGDSVNLFYGVLWHHLFGLLMLAGGLVLLALRPRRLLRRWTGMLLVVGWVAYNLFTVNWQFNLAAPQQVPQFTPNGVVSFLQEHAGPNSEPVGRISSGGFLPGGNSAASVYNLQDLTGNTPLQLARMQQFQMQMPAWELWQLMNVRYIVDQRDIGDPGLQLVYQEDETRVYAMGDSFERAWFVTDVVVEADDNRAIEMLASGAVNLREQAVVPGQLPGALQPEATGTVLVSGHSPGRLQLRTETSGTVLLVVSETYDPGWYILVDGRPEKPLRVNVVQQGIVIGEGEHDIELYYWPTSLTVGLVISMVALILSVGLIVTTGLLAISHR
jgi:hypothetical protein